MNKFNNSSSQPQIMQPSALSVSGFAKRYKGNKEYSVDHVNFEVRPGQFHGFIGSNGAGKTTTIKSLVGAYAKFEGSVTVFGKKSDTVVAKKHIGYIPEKADFPKELSCYQYIWRMANLAGYSKTEAKKFADHRIKQMGLEKYRKVSPLKLSSGQKKKVLLAQALAHNPDLIIMDEPAANLDPKARSDFFNVLKELQKEGKSIFMSSHILAELQDFVDSVTILDHGKVLYTGDVTELRENKDNKFNVRFESNEEWKTFKEFLTKSKIDSKKSGQSYTVTFKTKENINKSLKFILSKKLNILEFATVVKSLQEVYDDIVKKGVRNA